MMLVNISIVEGHQVIILWIVVKVEPNITFIRLFQIIKAGRHPGICCITELSQTELEKVLVSLFKTSFSVVDGNLLVDEVCCFWAAYEVFSTSDDEFALASTSATSKQHALRNAFTVLMELQRQIDMKNLPSLIPERTKLFNDLVTFICLMGLVSAVSLTSFFVILES